jgi:hypothetical protein
VNVKGAILIPEKRDETDTSGKRKPKPKIEIKPPQSFGSKKTETKRPEASTKKTVMNDLDAFFGEKTEEKKVGEEVAKHIEEKVEEEEGEYVYEEVEDDS